MNDIIDVVVEIPYMSNVKYEIEGTNLWVDRVLPVPMMYPGNYGFIPNTLAGDGDPVDVLIINSTPFLPMCHVKCRVLGMLETTDEKGPDEKVIAIPIHKVENTFRSAVQSDRARIQIAGISRFGLLVLSRQRLRPSLEETYDIQHVQVRGTRSLGQSILRIISEDAAKENTGEIHVYVPADV